MPNNFRPQSAGYLCNHIARLFSQLLSNALSPLKIAPAQFPILIELWQQDGLTQQQLVQRADLKQATIANTLARMERDGLIERRSHPTDARARIIYLTEQAKALQNQATAYATQINEQVLSALTPTEQQQFIHMLNQLIAQQQKLLKS